MRYRRPPSMLGSRIHGVPRWMVLAWACAVGPAARAGEPQAAPPTSPVLHVIGGGFVAGTFRDTDKPGMLRWQGRPFAAPFDFDIKAIDGVQVPAPAQPPRPEGDFRFELSGGDVVFGALVKLDENEADLDLARIGPLRLQRSHLLRIERWRDRADLVYLGPTGLTGWKLTPANDPNAWREESGELFTDQEGVALFKDIALPARAAFDIELSWIGKPDFVLALGVGDDEKTMASAFRFEVWGDDLVVQREAQEADLASVAHVGSGPGRVHLRVFLDQERGRIVVESADGKTLADLKVAERNPRVLTGVRLENKKGDVRLERLEVTQWNGELLREGLPDGPALRRTNGSSLSAKGVRYDAESKSFVVPEGEKESIVPRNEVDRVTFSRLVDGPARSVNITLQDGSRLSGDLLRVEKEAVVLALPGAEEPVRVPVDRLRSLVAHHGDGAPEEKPGSTPRLEMEGVRLTGRLVDGHNDPGAGCLTWQPTGSATASSLVGEASGRVVYKEPPPKPKTPTVIAGQAQRGGVVMLAGVAPPAPANPRPVPPQGGLQGFVMAFAGVSPRPSTAAGSTGAVSSWRRSLYLRTGDVIPAEVTKLDEKGVTIRTDMSESTFVPHEMIKAVELSQDPIVPVRLNKSKRERLLTLPRMQKGSPPTHLIRSKNGDYLRGRVVEIDEKTLKVEIRLEVKTIPRDRVARIIWLHAEDPEASKDPEAPPAPAAPANGPLQVQAVRKDGVRLTFVPERFENGTLSGKSLVLGDCRVRLDEVDELLIGKTIEKEASQLAFQRWLLTDAPEPKVTQEDGDGSSSGGGASGLSSPLVGKPAPDFSLEQLGGKTFRLAETKGKVVVLDFWATWCGPCLQAMPQVEKVTGEFRDQGVQLIAVNLQEAPKDITAMLERHKLNLTVALDKDGVVAEKYKANAIPQTVIIDREGNVARLFVGGGPHLGDQLREALQATLGGPDAKGPAK